MPIDSDVTLAVYYKIHSVNQDPQWDEVRACFRHAAMAAVLHGHKVKAIVEDETELYQYRNDADRPDMCDICTGRAHLEKLGRSKAKAQDS